MQAPLLGAPRAEAARGTRQFLLLLGALLAATMWLCWSGSTFLAERPALRQEAPSSPRLWSLLCEDCQTPVEKVRRECGNNVSNYRGQLSECNSYLDTCKNKRKIFRDRAREAERECRLNVSNFVGQLQDCNSRLNDCNTRLGDCKNHGQVFVDQNRESNDQLKECSSHLANCRSDCQLYATQARESKIGISSCQGQLKECQDTLHGYKDEDADIRKAWRAADFDKDKAAQLRTERDHYKETIGELEKVRDALIVLSVVVLAALLVVVGYWWNKGRREKLQAVQEKLQAVQERQRLEHIQKNPTMYDLILDTDSFSQMLKMKCMEVIRTSARLAEKFPEGAAKLAQVSPNKALQLFEGSPMAYKIVAVAGKYDAGKTFLLNKMLGLHFPSGKTCQTYGISLYELVFPNNRAIVVADSAGTHVPNDQRSGVDENTPADQVNDRRRTELQDRVLNARLSEDYRLELTGRSADCVIYVTNDFSPLDEQQIMKICSHPLSGGRDASLRTLFVVHNLKDVDRVEEAEQVWQSQVLDKFVNSKCGDDNLLHCSVRCAATKMIRHHIGLCKEGSEAGQKYNAEGIKTLTQEVLHNYGKTNVPLCRLIEEATAKMWETRVRAEPGLEGPKQPQVVWERGADGAGCFRLKNLGKELFESAKELPSGEITIIDSRLNLVHNVVKTSDRELKVVVECPGCTPVLVDLFTNYKELQLVIEKEKSFEERDELMPEIPVKEAWGTWRKSIFFERGVDFVPPTDIHGTALRDNTGQEMAYSFENGILTVKLKYREAAASRQGRSTARASREQPQIPPAVAAPATGDQVAAIETTVGTPPAQPPPATKSLDLPSPSSATPEPDAEALSSPPGDTTPSESEHAQGSPDGHVAVR